MRTILLFLTCTCLTIGCKAKTATSPTPTNLPVYGTWQIDMGTTPVESVPITVMSKKGSVKYYSYYTFSENLFSWTQICESPEFGRAVNSGNLPAEINETQIIFPKSNMKMTSTADWCDGAMSGNGEPAYYIIRNERLELSSKNNEGMMRTTPLKRTTVPTK